MNLAKAHRLAGDDAAEEAALEGALAIDQRHFMALVRLAELFERLGQRQRAADRWSGVLAMAPAIEEPTPALKAMFEHARDFVADQRADFAAAVNKALEPAREGMNASQRRRFDASVDHTMGRRQIYANQCAGLHFPFLPADEYFERSHFPWFETIEAQAGMIRAELAALLAADQPAILPYVSMAPGTPVNKWSALDNKLDWGAFHLWKNGQRDDVACARCPKTAAAVEALPLADIPGRAPTVFFSLLQPGARLPAHTGVSNVRTVIHLPLVVPPGCGFRVGGETREWQENVAWAFDDTIEHEAWNNSDRLRAILIFDTWNPYIREEEKALIRAFYVAADANGYDQPVMDV
jgi:aspartyl/asparaginyl beta-hydroxylase (cupin superfamily)